MLTSDLAEEYSGIQARVGGQEITWGDQELGTSYTRGYSLEDMLNLPVLGVKASAVTSTGWCQSIEL